MRELWQKNYDLLFVAVLGVALAALIGGQVLNGFPMVIGGLLLVFVLPGYPLAQLVRPQRMPDFATLALFILVLSLIVSILGGLVLAQTAIGLRRESWAIFLAIVIVGGTLMTIISRMQGYSDSPQLPDLPGALPWSAAIATSIVIILSVSSLALSVHLATQRFDSGFTQLWATPLSQDPAFTKLALGVKSDELTTQAFTVVLEVNGGTPQSFTFTLLPAQEWDRTIVIPVTQGIGVVTFSASLYRPDMSRAIYRHVSLQFNPQASATATTRASPTASKPGP